MNNAENEINNPWDTNSLVQKDQICRTTYAHRQSLTHIWFFLKKFYVINCKWKPGKWNSEAIQEISLMLHLILDLEFNIVLLVLDMDNSIGQVGLQLRLNQKCNLISPSSSPHISWSEYWSGFCAHTNLWYGKTKGFLPLWEEQISNWVKMSNRLKCKP